MMNPAVTATFAVLALSAAVGGGIYYREPLLQSVSQAVHGKICGVNALYDYTIIGAGTAGSIAAWVLSSNPDICVHLVGDGGDPRTWKFPDTVGLAPPFCVLGDSPEPSWPPSSAVAYSYEVTDPYNTMQTFMWKNQGWGGASARNTLVVDANDCTNYDKLIAAIPGAAADGWDCASVQQLFAALTTFKAPAGYPIDPRINGRHGPLVMQVWNPDPATNAWMQAFANVTGTPLYKNFNLNTGTGVGIVQRGIDTAPDGSFVRQNTFLKAIIDTGIWNPEGTGSRRNLVVDSYVTVKKLLFSNGGRHGRPTAIGFTYEQTLNESGSPTVWGQEFVASGGEILLAAGQPSTIALLQLSGIGDCNALANLQPGGIDCVYHNPSVGNSTQNTQQIAMLFVIKVPWQNRVDCAAGNAYLRSALAQSLGQVEPDAAIGFVQLAPVQWDASDPTLYTLLLALPATYRNRGDPIGQFGTETVKDADPHSIPYVAFNTNPEGLEDATETARQVCTYMNNVMGIPCVEASPGTGAVPNIPADIAAWAASVDFNDYAHMNSGAGIGPVDSHGNPLPGTVLDTKMRVIGVNNLRVIDLAATPSSPDLQIPKHSFMYQAVINGAKGALFILQSLGFTWPGWAAAAAP